MSFRFLVTQGVLSLLALLHQTFLGVVLKSNRILVGYSHRLCVSIALASLTDITASQIKGFMAGLVFTFLIGSMYSTFLYQRQKHIGLKALWRHQLGFSMVNNGSTVF